MGASFFVFWIAEPEPKKNDGNNYGWQCLNKGDNGCAYGTYYAHCHHNQQQGYEH